ncbi:hypothetical protein [Burkholderia stabilis]|uniref:Uncharacterized protein n=1 Tax=Burkholderia stabilis TaxID=95485 RepID=A0A1Y1BSJ3_9BURK|nr:hypothetical protein [Burkholderia stabilis]BAX62884.1 hypothetical protein BSFP_057520 [Burkholderia stabilis]
MEMLKRAWAGEERLWKVWWLIGAPLYIFNNLVLASVESYTLSDPLGANKALIFSIFAVLFVEWFAWVAVAWRCAPNVDNQFWRGASRVALWGFILMNLLMGRQSSKEFGDKLSDATMRQLAADNAPSAQPSPLPAEPPPVPAPAPQGAAPTSTDTAWDNGLGRAAYIDSHWHPMKPPGGGLPNAGYLGYEGKGDIAVVRRFLTRMSPQAYLGYYTQHMGEYRPAQPPKLGHFEGHLAWSTLLRTSSQTSGILFIFRDLQGYTWQVFTASTVPDEGFFDRSLALDKAVLRSVF